jgi:plasmid maintenance system antidote protein VapI
MTIELGDALVKAHANAPEPYKRSPETKRSGMNALAQAADIDASLLSRAFGGDRNLNPQDISKLSDVLGVPVKDRARLYLLADGYPLEMLVSIIPGLEFLSPDYPIPESAITMFRKFAGTMTHTAISEKLHIDSSTISRFLAGKRNFTPTVAIQASRGFPIPYEEKAVFYLLAAGHTQEVVTHVLEPHKGKSFVPKK